MSSSQTRLAEEIDEIDDDDSYSMARQRKDRPPWLHQSNTWTWRFIPGFILGIILKMWVDSDQKSTNNNNSNKQISNSQQQQQQQIGEIPEKIKEECKMVLCVNESLKMGKGKIAAQCAHAAVGVLNDFQNKQQCRPFFRQWESRGQAKIALKVPSEAELFDIQSKAKKMGFPYYLVCDAGRTQIAAGSRTVLAVGPAPKSKVDEITGHLKLL
eukprot:TRINITY_DN1346_c0_g3_i1.p2 TRINITY_DN1346_c0_g3~~TRINITY_DN1346_c0_g3_i1.p2  ORF type:complete len:213 (-),score=42.18 TRINITY_DN1346_c0_g3_i1:298-936(-)